jgi:hypothetical protein
LNLDQILQEEEILGVEVANTFVIRSFLHSLYYLLELIAQSGLAIDDSLYQFLALLNISSAQFTRLLGLSCEDGELAGEDGGTLERVGVFL